VDRERGHARGRALARPLGDHALAAVRDHNQRRAVLQNIVDRRLVRRQVRQQPGQVDRADLDDVGQLEQPLDRRAVARLVAHQPGADVRVELDQRAALEPLDGGEHGAGRRAAQQADRADVQRAGLLEQRLGQVGGRHQRVGRALAVERVGRLAAFVRHERQGAQRVGRQQEARVDAFALDVGAQVVAEQVVGGLARERGRLAQPRHADGDVQRRPARVHAKANRPPLFFDRQEIDQDLAHAGD